MGGGDRDGGTHVYPWLIHVDVWQKTSHSVVFNALATLLFLKYSLPLDSMVIYAPGFSLATFPQSFSFT